jgi:hypothetical protein
MRDGIKRADIYETVYEDTLASHNEARSQEKRMRIEKKREAARLAKSKAKTEKEEAELERVKKMEAAKGLLSIRSLYVLSCLRTAMTC